MKRMIESNYNFEDNHVSKIVFVDTLKDIIDYKEDVDYLEDISEDKDKSVMLWKKKGVLYVGAEGGVIANYNSSELFKFCMSVEEIYCGKNFDTRYVTNMREMFYWCTNLKKIDISNFDRNNVIDDTDMFEYCSCMVDVAENY